MGGLSVLLFPFFIYWGYRFIKGDYSFIGEKMVNHSKCKKCGEILNVINLKENPEGVGMACVDETKCANRQQKSEQNHT